ncbi:MAG: dihydroorotate dehydrogenase electron transfer subunit [Treponema sp.]|jgi:NAD(P)H-flavin reductase|nr:dihydroorotate dehydrogenase electron transfer subunit [Treponema sp.]
MSGKVINVTFINKEVFRLDVARHGARPEVATRPEVAAPKAGQFFMIKPKRSAVFLCRPICVTFWQADKITFLIAMIGKGTRELASMHIGEEIELIGPRGNAWTDFLSVEKIRAKPVALIGGSLGVAPLNALLCETQEYAFDLYAGFKTGFETQEEKDALLGPAEKARNVIIASEDGKTGQKGLILDFLEPEKYAAVCACGTLPMLKAVAKKCIAKKVPCFISMESRMACGVGACLGCAVKTVNGNRRCCADGPIFKAEEVIFND